MAGAGVGGLRGYEKAARLDVTFAALADPTRRAIPARLAKGEASVMELAEPFAMSPPAISKHRKVLERAGLVSRGRDAQRRLAAWKARPLRAATEWPAGCRRFWTESFENLDALLDELKTQQKRRLARQAKEEEEVKNTGNLKITTVSDREIAITRVFEAPRRLVFDAWTKPELVKRWLGVQGGWSLEVCEIDLRVGGRYRFVWRSSTGTLMGMGGVYREIVAPERIVSTELFDEAWYPGEAVGTLTFVEQGGRTTLTQTLLYESKEARDAVLRSPMEGGLAASYDKLEEVLGSLRAAEQSSASA